MTSKIIFTPFIGSILCSQTIVTAADKPVKIFILAGQSNMEGHRFIPANPKRNAGKGSLEFLAKGNPITDKFKHLLGKDGK